MRTSKRKRRARENNKKFGRKAMDNKTNAENNKSRCEAHMHTPSKRESKRDRRMQNRMRTSHSSTTKENENRFGHTMCDVCDKNVISKGNSVCHESKANETRRRREGITRMHAIAIRIRMKDTYTHTRGINE